MTNLSSKNIKSMTFKVKFDDKIIPMFRDFQYVLRITRYLIFFLRVYYFKNLQMWCLLFQKSTDVIFKKIVFILPRQNRESVLLEIDTKANFC